jgi:hypothetical protein
VQNFAICAVYERFLNSFKAFVYKGYSDLWESFLYKKYSFFIVFVAKKGKIVKIYRKMRLPRTQGVLAMTDREQE